MEQSQRKGKAKKGVDERKRARGEGGGNGGRGGSIQESLLPDKVNSTMKE